MGHRTGGRAVFGESLGGRTSRVPLREMTIGHLVMVDWGSPSGVQLSPQIDPAKPQFVPFGDGLAFALSIKIQLFVIDRKTSYRSCAENGKCLTGVIFGSRRIVSARQKSNS